MSIEPKYLIFVDGDVNHNKYYEMVPEGGQFTVKYGRVGQPSFQSMTYSIDQFDKKYREKIKKGYVDKTNLRAELITKVKANKDFRDIPNATIKSIVERLQAMAKQAIAENYTISSNKVTQKMVDEAQAQIGSFSDTDSVTNFNRKLIDLFQIIPRRMGKVSEYLAKSKEDFAKILQIEQDLLDVMRGQVVQNSFTEEDKDEDGNIPDMTILDAMGLIFEEVSKADIDLIKKQLAESKDKFYQAWKVVNKKTQASFDKYVKDNNIKEKKLLWHGSRNENWWNIINSGLVLRPNAITTGKMFGFGIYFAPKAQKSLGYTSISGSYWASGNSKSAFMSLYDVAYGTPHVVYDFNSQFHDLNYDKLQKLKSGANCLHAKSDKGMLRNDEIIVYKEEQMTIKYLVELR